jgi:outer membrane protein
MEKKRALALVLLVATFMVGVGSWMGRAAKEGDAGVVDMQVVGEQYVHPLLDPQLQQELLRLQTELDTKVKGLDEKAQADLFAKYQAQLDAKRDELLDGYLAKVSTAVNQVMKETGLRVVLDKDVVLAGGVDVTNQVLAKLKVPAPKK